MSLLQKLPFFKIHSTTALTGNIFYIEPWYKLLMQSGERLFLPLGVILFTIYLLLSLIHFLKNKKINQI